MLGVVRLPLNVQKYGMRGAENISFPIGAMHDYVTWYTYRLDVVLTDLTYNCKHR